MKIFLITILSILTLNAGLVNAIAMSVNDKPITLLDIDSTMNQKNVSKEQAIKILIDEALYEQEMVKNRIRIDSLDVDKYVEQLAANNNMTLYAFKNALKQQQDYTLFEENVKKQLKHQKLIQVIAANKLTQASNEDIEIYYTSHNEEFQIANKVDVIHYSSTDKKALEATKLNPMMAQNGVYSENITIDLKTVSSQMQYILTQTKVQNYSAIFAENRAYHMFFVSNKTDVSTVSLDKVKNQIYNHLMKTREDEFLKNYFEALKISADIKILR